MSNRAYLTITGISILVAFIGILLFNFSDELNTVERGWSMFDYGLRIGAFSGLVLMITNGTFIKTRYFKIAQGCIAIIIIGALLKILHWTTYANLIFVVGLLGIMTSYILSFIKKPIKKRLDYLKLLWVIVSYISGILVFLHIVSRDYSEIGTYIFWLVLIDFCYANLRNGKLLKTE